MTLSITTHSILTTSKMKLDTTILSIQLKKGVTLLNENVMLSVVITNVVLLRVVAPSEGHQTNGINEIFV
jgi:hypothetical protein